MLFCPSFTQFERFLQTDQLIIRLQVVVVSVCCLGELLWIFQVLVLGSSGSRSHNVFRDGDSDLAPRIWQFTSSH